MPHYSRAWYHNAIHNQCIDIFLYQYILQISHPKSLRTFCNIGLRMYKKSVCLGTQKCKFVKFLVMFSRIFLHRINVVCVTDILCQ